MRSNLTAILLVVAVLAAPLVAQEGRPKSTTDGRFTIEVELPRLDVISQDRTGTCWSFATVSFLESELERIHGKRIDLSEMFPVYFTYLEKARRFVRLHGKAQFSEGGLCHDVIHAIKHHGIAPATGFDGLCGDDTQHDHSELVSLLEGIVKKMAEAKKPGVKWEGAVRGVLDAYLGEVPTTVEYEGATITPKEYADQVLRFPYDDYVTLMSFSYSPFWERGELLVPDNWMRYQDYKNVPVDTMMSALDHALRSGYSVAVDMDVSERGFKAGRGIAQLSDKLEKKGAVTDALRQRMFDDRSTTDDHLMHVVGMATDKDGKTWYLTKNSWGAVGPYKGQLFMSRNFVAAKMLSFMVHKDGLPAEVLKRVTF